MKPALDPKEIAFRHWWLAYPLKIAVADARVAFHKALEITTAQALIEGAHRFARDPNRQLEFTPYPARWLNQQRWMDGPLPPRKLSPQEIEEAEQTKVKEREMARIERDLALSLELEASKNAAVPMPEEVKDLRNRLKYGVSQL